jgi:hypothetical protein
MVETDISTVSVLIDGISSNNNTSQQIILFQIYKEGIRYKVVPLIDEVQRGLMRLPKVLSFEFKDHCIVPDRSRNDETLELIKKIVRECILQDRME